MPFLEEGARRVDTLFHFERKARVASIPSSISGKGRASTKWIVFPPPPFLEEGARRVDTLLHFWRRARRIDTLLHFWRRARVASL
jgi:hypothetical protein